MPTFKGLVSEPLPGNTMLGSKEVEMLSVLRINRPFMEYARSHYAEAAKQQFNKTVVDDPATLPPPAAPPHAPSAAGCSTDEI